jgi:hypothetical protein
VFACRTEPHTHTVGPADGFVRPVGLVLCVTQEKQNIIKCWRNAMLRFMDGLRLFGHFGLKILYYVSTFPAISVPKDRAHNSFSVL